MRSPSLLLLLAAGLTCSVLPTENIYAEPGSAADSTAKEVVAEDDAGAADAAAKEAAAAVDDLHQQLLALARGNLTAPLRRERLQPLVKERFGLPLIARLSIGSRWRALNDEQRAKLTTLLGSIIVATYAERFSEPSSASFELLTARPGRRGPVVEAVIVRQNAADVSLDYHFRNGKIYNVVADGVSDLSLRRADYSGVLKREGYDALLAHLTAQRDRLESEDDDPPTDGR